MILFDINLSKVLAHTVMYESELEYPRKYTKDFTNNSDPPAPTPQESTASIMQALTQNLPALTRSISKTALPYEQSNFETQAAIAPLYTDLQTKLYGQFGPQLNQIGQDIARSNALSQAETDSQVVNSGAARDLIKGTDELQRSIDPEYYKNREATSKSYGNLIGGLDPNNLNEAELASVERGVNRSNIGTGLADSASKTGAISNALQFDDRINQKRGLLTQALSNFSGIQSGSKSGVDVFQQTTGKPSASSFGQQNFVGAGQNANANTSGLASGLLGQISQNAGIGMQINANRRDPLDRVNQTTSSILGNY